MRASRQARVLLFIGAAGALMATGATMALFSDQTPVQSTVDSTGSVTLGKPATTLKSIDNLVPGASGSDTYTITYTGTAPAWLGIIPRVSGDLLACDNGKMQFTLTNDGQPDVRYRWNQPAPQVVRTGGTPDSPVAHPVSQGATWSFRVGYSLPLVTGNDCQTRRATIELQVVAVQAGFNTNDAGNGPISWDIPVDPGPDPIELGEREWLRITQA